MFPSLSHSLGPFSLRRPRKINGTQGPVLASPLRIAKIVLLSANPSAPQGTIPLSAPYSPLCMDTRKRNR